MKKLKIQKALLAICLALPITLTTCNEINAMKSNNEGNISGNAQGRQENRQKPLTDNQHKDFLRKYIRYDIANYIAWWLYTTCASSPPYTTPEDKQTIAKIGLYFHLQEILNEELSDNAQGRQENRQKHLTDSPQRAFLRKYIRDDITKNQALWDQTTCMDFTTNKTPEAKETRDKIELYLQLHEILDEELSDMEYFLSNHTTGGKTTAGAILSIYRRYNAMISNNEGNISDNAQGTDIDKLEQLVKLMSDFDEAYNKKLDKGKNETGEESRRQQAEEEKAKKEKEEKERAEKIEESKEVTNENLNQNKGQDSNLTTTQKIIKNLSATNKMLQNIMQILY